MWMEVDVKLSDLVKLNGVSVNFWKDKPIDDTCNKNEMRHH